MNKFISGRYISQGSYSSFQPNMIHREWHLDDMEIIAMLSEADRCIGRLDMYSEYVPNIDLFIQMHVAKEATLSSKIEGTRTEIHEALLDAEDLRGEHRDDWQEVQNYIQAMNKVLQERDNIPFSSRLIRFAHAELMQGVRGEHKAPGEYRKSQNWIGGASLKDALFVPPVQNTIGDLMSDLEHFVHDTEHPFPDLLKVALMHYQFETIHPFLDGNGRVGRLMITLYLIEKGLLKRPVLYLSDFIEKNRSVYYDNLMRVREKNDLKQWFKFFLVGIIETATKGVETFDCIMKLQEKVNEKIESLGSRAKKAKVLMEHLYERPIIDAQRAKEVLNSSYPTVYKLLEDLQHMEILAETTGGQRGQRFAFEEYLNLFR